MREVTAGKETFSVQLSNKGMGLCPLAQCRIHTRLPTRTRCTESRKGVVVHTQGNLGFVGTCGASTLGLGSCNPGLHFFISQRPVVFIHAISNVKRLLGYGTNGFLQLLKCHVFGCQSSHSSSPFPSHLRGDN